MSPAMAGTATFSMAMSMPSRNRAPQTTASTAQPVPAAVVVGRPAPLVSVTPLSLLMTFTPCYHHDRSARSGHGTRRHFDVTRLPGRNRRGPARVPGRRGPVPVGRPGGLPGAADPGPHRRQVVAAGDLAARREDDAVRRARPRDR